MKNMNFKYYLVAILSSLLFFACKKYPDPDLARSEKYVRATENFEIESFESNLTSDSISFPKESVVFKAEFNEEVSWTITITGKASPEDHAIKVFKGTSMIIDSSLASWDGASDNIYFFKKDEYLNIKLEILGSDKVREWDSYYVSSPKDFNAKDNVIVLLNFEGSGALINEPGSVFTFFDTENKSEFIDSLAFVGSDALVRSNCDNLDGAIDCSTLELGKGNIPTPVEGNGLIYVRGKDIVGQPNSFFIGGFNHSPSIYGLDAPLDSIYLNFYANSWGNKTTKLSIELEGIGGDIFKSEKNITWSGWKLVSIKLSDMVLGTAGTLGTGVMIPKALKKLGIQIHSGDGPGKEAEMLIDYVCFTYGAPFRQSN